MDEMLNIDYDEDIQRLLEKLEDIRLETYNVDLLTTFANDYAYPVIVLLNELKKRRAAARNQGQSGGGAIGSHRVILEGYSENTMQEAFSNALEKAYHYFSALYDVNITILGMVRLKSGGHRATIELHIVPMTAKHTRKREGADVERNHNKVRGEKSYRQTHDEYMGHLLHDHFIITAKENYIPDYLLVSVNDAELLNFMVEHDFFHASHKDKAHEKNEFVVRMRKPKPDKK